MQRRVDRHHPQRESSVQLPHSVCPLHGSGGGAVQAATLPDQAEAQAPEAGPLRAVLAVTQRLEAPHHPQPACAAQAPQDVAALQGSTAVQALAVQAQPSAQVAPPTGPVAEPSMQRAVRAHQPQVDCAVHEAQEVCVAQLPVVGVPRSVGTLPRSREKPTSGRVEGPVSSAEEPTSGSTETLPASGLVGPRSGGSTGRSKVGTAASSWVGAASSSSP
jgi:hypothetical protein